MPYSIFRELCKETILVGFTLADFLEQSEFIQCCISDVVHGVMYKNELFEECVYTVYHNIEVDLYDYKK